MGLLSDVSGRDCRRVLEKAGFAFVRQSGSHMMIRRAAITISIPDHRELKPGTLRAIIRQADLTVEEFLTLLGYNCHCERASHDGLNSATNLL